MLENEVVVITGGCGLIGKSFVTSVAEAGGIAIIADLDIEKGNTLINESELKNNLDFVFMDVTDKKSIEKAIGDVHDKYGKIDALVNNAYPRNKNYGKHFYDVKYKDFCENLGLNLGGYFLTSQRFANYFTEQKQGNIINIASIYGVISPRFHIYDDTQMTTPVEYAAIKSGLIHLTKYMAQYFKPNNIRVNAISPGGIFDHQPETFLKGYKYYCASKGMLDSEDIRGALLFLLSKHSKFINGQNIVVDDGFSL